MVNDEHAQKVPHLIEVTDEGIEKVICVNDEHPMKAEFQMNKDAEDSFSYDYIVNSHLKSDIKSTQEKKSVLHIAVENENIDFIKMLLNSNINIDSVDYNGKKLVECTNNEEIIRLLSH